MAIENMSPFEDKTRISASSIALAESAADVTNTFNDTGITYNGDITGYDYTRLQRDKQENIYDAYKLADFFLDSDEIYGGALKFVYLPFALTDGFYLTGGDPKVRAKYEEWFQRIGLEEKLESWFMQYFNFANVFFSLMEDGYLVTLPPVLSRVTNVKVNGNPLIEFNARAVKQDLKKQGQKALKKFLDDEKLDDFNIYIQKIKQKNEVEFNEDGSIVKSVTMASFGNGGKAAPMENDTLDVKLNQPFIYIIRDINGTPIFVGHVDNPTIQ